MYYKPEDIVFNKPQLIFLLTYLSIVRDGNWVYPDGSIQDNGDYSLLKDTSIAHINGNGMNGSPPASDYALRKLYYQEKVKEIARELDARLKLCDDGELLVERYKNRLEIKDLCRLFNLERQQVYRRSHLAIKYLSGKYRKTIDYKSWLRNKGG